ncbi:MAG: hypothetical protein ACLFMO_01445 [Eubacteriales bacterium]
MWIRTQNEKELVNVIKISILKNSFSKKKAVILGKFSNGSFFDDGSTRLGLYDSFDEAIEELNNIQNFIKENPNGIYQMK